MKNLANACQTYGMEVGRYPLAGSVEIAQLDPSNRRRPVMKYKDRPGWVSLDTQGKYPSGGASSHSANAIVGMFSEDVDKSSHALTNGCLWKYVARNRQTYVCPLHVKKCSGGVRPHWSYLMNGLFGWDMSNGNKYYRSKGIDYGKLPNADKILLFSEVPFSNNSSWQPEGEGGTADTDSVLDFSPNGISASRINTLKNSYGGTINDGGRELIGANHVSGRNLFAHVAFADGHVEKLRIPYSGNIKNPEIDEGQLKNLTSYLCTGTDYSFDGRQYSKMEN
jgi:prepilin-type processing-associated H-X9-DG protein